MSRHRVTNEQHLIECMARHRVTNEQHLIECMARLRVTNEQHLIDALDLIECMHVYFCNSNHSKLFDSYFRHNMQYSEL